MATALNDSINDDDNSNSSSSSGGSSIGVITERKRVNDLPLLPLNVKGMTQLDKTKFQNQIKIPVLNIKNVNNLNAIMPYVQRFILKIDNIKPIQQIPKMVVVDDDDDDDGFDNDSDAVAAAAVAAAAKTTTSLSQSLKKGAIQNNIDDDDCDKGDNDKKTRKIKNNNNGKLILLNPSRIKTFSDLSSVDLKKLGVTEQDFVWQSIKLTYENYKLDDILRAILPDEYETVSSWSTIGHIIHVNLRDYHFEYKQIIGQLLFEKSSGCRTVVNKCQPIDSQFRSLNFELLYGDADYQVTVKENGIKFEFDFSTVYWNPRLSTEHERIVLSLKSNDILYDVFAGVGPFSVPAARKKCTVFANDLNPASYQWLTNNFKINHCKNEYFKVYNLDGHDFIRDIIKIDLIKRWQEPTSSTSNSKNTIHITMNLPAIAITFLPTFCGLLNGLDPNTSFTTINYPLIHVYCFIATTTNSGSSKTAKKTIEEEEEPEEETDPKKIAQRKVEQAIDMPLTDNLKGIHFVRNVSLKKNMYRISFYLNEQILFNRNFDKLKHNNKDENDSISSEIIPNKKIKLS